MKYTWFIRMRDLHAMPITNITGSLFVTKTGNMDAGGECSPVELCFNE